MKQVSFLYLFVGLFLTLSSCSCGSSNADNDKYTMGDSVAPAPAPVFDIAELEDVKFVVINEDDEKVILKPNIYTLYCIMATWCPYSKILMENIANPKYSAIFNKYNIVFLFFADEITLFQRKVKANPEETGLTDAQLKVALQNLEDMKTLSKVCSPEFLSDIPPSVKYYYIKDQFDFETQGIPCCYNSSANNFKMSPYEWLFNRQTTNANRELINAMVPRSEN